LALAGWFSVTAIMVPMFLQGVASGFVFPPSMAMGVGAHPRIAGTASGMLGVFQMGASAIASFVASLFVHETMLPVGIIMLLLASVGLVAIFMIGRGDHEEESASA